MHADLNRAGSGRTFAVRCISQSESGAARTIVMGGMANISDETVGWMRATRTTPSPGLTIRGLLSRDSNRTPVNGVRIWPIGLSVDRHSPPMGSQHLRHLWDLSFRIRHVILFGNQQPPGTRSPSLAGWFARTPASGAGSFTRLGSISFGLRDVRRWNRTSSRPTECGTPYSPNSNFRPSS